MSPSYHLDELSQPIVTDLMVCVHPPPNKEMDQRAWHRVEKDLCLHTSTSGTWLYLELANKEELTLEDVLITDINVGEVSFSSSESQSWEERPGGIWIQRSTFSGEIGQAVTGVDVLFGADAVDPRPCWHLIQSPLQLNTPAEVPVARLTVLYGRAKPRLEQTDLRTKENGRFKILQISDMHMVTGVGICTDAIDAHGKHLAESEADPLTVSFVGGVLDDEKPDLVILTGDQLHHDVLDSQTVLLKVVDPIIERAIPFAAVFGNHDSEGIYALPRAAQMSILQDLPYSLCEPGPAQVDGTGNYFLQILAPAPSRMPVSTLYLFDSHGQMPTEVFRNDYEPIKQSQIDWFVRTAQSHRDEREKNGFDKLFHISLAFLHIPLPEFGDHRLEIRSGCRREPTEGSSFNSHLYNALAQEGISAVACGHDHVNDFCALLSQQAQRTGEITCQSGPWLCYGGGSGFGGYCSYDDERFHRRLRVWELDASVGKLKTWMRVEYLTHRIQELTLVENGAVANNHG